jgi:hypothetical protein
MTTTAIPLARDVVGNDQRDVSQSVVDEMVYVDPTLASLQAEWGVSPIPGKK